MGRAALREVRARLVQTQIPIHCQPHIRGIHVLLAVILPPADGTQRQRSRRLQRPIAAARTAKMSTQGSPSAVWTENCVYRFTPLLREPGSAGCSNGCRVDLQVYATLYTNRKNALTGFVVGFSNIRHQGKVADDHQIPGDGRKHVR